MAQAPVEIALRQLTQLIQDEYGLLVGVSNEIERLHSTFTAIKAVISDAERKQLKEESVRDWLRKLKNVAYEVDDVLQEWATSSFLSDGSDKVCSPVTSPCGLFIQLKLRDRVARRIRDINEKLEWIKNERNNYHFREAQVVEVEKRETSSLEDIDQEIFGRREETEDIISKLICESSYEEKHFSVISIVGMGGMGKTTLARCVYNDLGVRDHFSLHIWFCVSDDFKVSKLTEKIIESASGTKYEGPSDLNSMQNRLCEILSGKKLLIVLDDVWNENPETWEQWSIPLQRCARGSRIVVTTRSNKVSRIMGSAHTIDLKALSEDDCWRVFKSKAFIGRTRDENLELEEVGRKIVEKCKGLPLAVRTIGSVMRFKRRKADWISMLESEMWDVQSGPMPALLISYDNLPSHLKSCFLYCALFPKDSEIVKNDLIKLWMAQGFVMPQRGKDIEDIGGEYFDDLIDRCLFQDVVKDNDENILFCKMHDLIHDLVRLLVKEECFVPDSADLAIQVLNPLVVRHLSYVSVYMEDFKIPQQLYHMSNLRTLLSLCLLTEAVPRNLFDHLRCLRTLHLSDSSITTLPSSIGHLKHLRYLDLSHTSLSKLPKQVTSLNNLQTLKLNHCYELCQLPRGLTTMVGLRHLEIEGTYNLKYTPKEIGGMHSLQTLSRFIVAVDGHGHSNIGELKSLKLRGNLEIQHLERVAGEDEAIDAELARKQHLNHLTLHCLCTEVKEKKLEGIFERLEPPHENLQVLHIEGYYGTKLPSWMQEMSVFSKLVRLRLRHCTNLKQLPSLGLLPLLKDLKISHNNEIEQVGCEFLGNSTVAFPRLEELEFCRMSKWTEWEMSFLEDGQQHNIMPRLFRLKIISCLKLKTWPALGRLPSLEDLRIYGNEVVERVGHELYGYCDSSDDAKGTAFPRLKRLQIFDMSKWEDWELRVENVETTMPCLLEASISECPKLKSLPDCLPPGLVKLTIMSCHEIVWMASQFHQALKVCEISQCEGLSSRRSSLPCLPNLEELEIGWTTSLPHNGWEQLKSLHTLKIKKCELASIPDGLRQVKSLNTLEIGFCSQLESLPNGVGQLESLQKLSVSYCPELKSLPDELTQLKSLSCIEIEYCPKLRLRQQHQHFNLWTSSSSVAGRVFVGEDWDKIKHIPNITINGESIDQKRMDENHMSS